MRGHRADHRGVRGGVFGTRLAPGIRVGAALGAAVLNAALLLLAYRVLTHRRLPARKLYGATLGGACAWQLLQWGGSYYVDHVLRGATATYGMFGIVLGLPARLYLGALIFLTTAEVSSVRVMRLWPRSLLTPFTDSGFGRDRRVPPCGGPFDGRRLGHPGATPDDPAEASR